MKSTALLVMATALAFAQDQSQSTTAKGRENKSTATVPAAKSPATGKPQIIAKPPQGSTKQAGRQGAATFPQQPVRPNLHKSSTPPATHELTPEQKAAAALPTVPEGAKPAGPNLYRYTDPQGKTWMYRQTPFGVSRWEDKPDQEQSAPDASKPAPASVKDLGDSVQFERATPFGPQKWIRKKSELTDEEKSILASQNDGKTTEGAKGDSSKPSEKQ